MKSLFFLCLILLTQVFANPVSDDDSDIDLNEWGCECRGKVCRSEDTWSRHQHHKKHHCVQEETIQLGPCAPSSAREPCSPNYQQTQDRLINIAGRSGGSVTIHTAGTSEQGRQLWYAKAGWGPRKYFAWGRIHGNECVGTEGLLLVLEKLIDGSKLSNKILKESTSIILPIANPDGSELGTRNSAPFPGWPEGRDLNRDWCLQGQNEMPSPCLVNSTTDPVTGLPEGGVPGQVCSCQPGSTSFITNETNALMNIVVNEKPDIVMDIHQFGAAFFPGTKILVGAQAVLPRFQTVAREDIVLRNLQVAQVLYDSFRLNGQIGTRWNLSSAPGQPSRSSALRIAESGNRNINETGFPTAGMGLEMRRVCPVYERNLQILTARLMFDQIWATANRKIFTINPTEATYFPFGNPFSCEGECPSVIPPEDRFPEDQIWSYLEDKHFKG